MMLFRESKRTVVGLLFACCTLAAAPDLALAEATFTANGVECSNDDGNDNTFSFTELGPSVLGANQARIEKIRRLGGYYDSVHEICQGQWFPGCGGVEDWHDWQNVQWPTSSDTDYLNKRIQLLDRDDDMLIEATRVWAHLTCQRQVPTPSEACVALVAAEELASPAVRRRVSDVLDCEGAKAPPGSKTLEEPVRRALAFYASYAYWTEDGTDKTCAPLPAPSAAAPTPKSGLQAAPPKKQGTGKDSAASANDPPASVIAIRDVFQAESKAAEAGKRADEEQSRLKTLEMAAQAAEARVASIEQRLGRERNGATTKRLDEEAAQAREVAEKAESDAKAQAIAVDQAEKKAAALRNQAAGMRTKALEQFKNEAFPPSSDNRFEWEPASTSVGRAANAILTNQPVPDPEPHAVRSGSEEEALARNLVACPNATFYVSPTRELVRHVLDGQVPNQISVCADTTGFAIDQPLQLRVTTPSAERIYRLWPGEPQVIPLETTLWEPQVARLTISGYPRREVLRSLARHVTGPLNGEDAFDLLQKAANSADDVGTTAATAKKTAERLESLGKRVAKNEAVSRAMLDLSKELGKKDPKDLAPRSDAFYVLLREAITKEPEYADIAAKKAIDGILPVATEPPPDHPDNKPTVTALAKAPGDIDLIAKSLAGFFDNLASAATQLKVTAKAAQETQDNLAKSARIMCELTSEVVPLVIEDVLVRGCGGADCDAKTNAPYLIQYDFTGGFERTNQARPIKDTDKVFVAVQDVRPGWSVGVALNDRSVVQRNTALIGLSQTDTAAFSFKDQTSESTPGFDALKPLDMDVLAPGTQILSLGTLSGGARYTLHVCASSSAADDCTTVVPTTSAPATPSSPGGVSGPSNTAASPAPPTSGTPPSPSSPGQSPSSGAALPSPSASSSTSPSTYPMPTSVPVHRTIALNSVVVRSYRHFGVRAGFGLSVDGTVDDRYRDLVPVPGSSNSSVRSRPGDAEFGVPLLVSYYIEGRDPMDLPHGFTTGPTVGLDLLNAFSSPRAYLGWVFDIGGVGITTAVSGEVAPTYDNATGSVVAPGAQQKDNDFLLGGFIGLTTDLDIFEAIFANYFSPLPFPTLASNASTH
jgi:hypothetical protein